MTAESNPLTFIGRIDFRGDNRLFGIRRADRRAHMYIIGKTGTGKSTLLEFLASQDIARGEGLALLDPHGDLVERVLAAVPEGRRDDLIYFNVPDPMQPLGFNPLESVQPLKRPLAASQLLDVFKKLWSDSWGPRLEHILRNALLALLDQPEATLADVLRLLGDEAYRKAASRRVLNPQVRDFWLREYASYPKNFRVEAIAPIQNKVGAFLANPLLQRILTQPRSSFDLCRVMDEGKILLVNLTKGKIGDDIAALLGSLLVSKIGLAGLTRSDVPEAERRDFYVYLDEFHSFTTLSIVNMLSELRKYRVNLILAHQHLSQLHDDVRDAIFGNIGTTIAFRVGVAEAQIFAEEFGPELAVPDIVNLPNYQMHVRLMVNSRLSRPFSGITLPRRFTL